MTEIHNKAAVRYHEVPIYRLLYKCGFKPIVPKRDLAVLDQRKRKDRSKRYKIISNMHKPNLYSYMTHQLEQ
jgi:hypothetical protein